MAERRRVAGQPEAVYIEWDDSAGTPGWCSDNEIDHAGTPMKCRTLGFLVKETGEALVVALNNAYGERIARPFGELITIPKSAITLRAGAEAFYLRKTP